MEVENGRFERLVDRGDHLHHRLGRDCILARTSCGPQGHSFLLYFIFSLFFFPAALIVAYLVRDRRAG